jgi:hypothetical protein
VWDGDTADKPDSLCGARRRYHQHRDNAQVEEQAVTVVLDLRDGVQQVQMLNDEEPSRQ